MSTSLYWSQVPDIKEYNIHCLKYILAKKLGSYDGSMSEDLGVVDKKLIPYLEGIADTGGDVGADAKKLIDAINKYEKVQLTIHS